MERKLDRSHARAAGGEILDPAGRTRIKGLRHLGQIPSTACAGHLSTPPGLVWPQVAREISQICWSALGETAKPATVRPCLRTSENTKQRAKSFLGKNGHHGLLRANSFAAL